MVLGHVTVTAAGRDLARKVVPAVDAVALPWLLLGAVLPDLVDKPLNHLLGLSGRGYGHSLVVQVTVFGLGWLVFRSHRKGIALVWAGASVHLLEDWVALVVLLAPLLGPVPQAPQWGFFASLVHFYRGGGPLVWLEVLAAGYWILRGGSWIRARSATSGSLPAPGQGQRR